MFDENARLTAPLTAVDSDEEKQAFLENLQQVDYKGRYTDSAAGLERALYHLKHKGREQARKAVVFLTDGIIDTGDEQKDAEKRRYLETTLARGSKNAGIRIFGVAFTEAADFTLIQTLAVQTGGEYYRVPTADEINGVFKSIQKEITKPAPEPIAPVTPSPVQPGQTAPHQPSPEMDVPAAVAPAPSEEQRGLPWPLILTAILIAAGVLVLWLLLKGGKRQARQAPGGGDPPRTDQPIPRAELVDTGSVTGQEKYIIAKRLVKIGRKGSENLDLAIDRDTVSGFHATIEYRDGFFYIEDQRSSNGTMLNDMKLEPAKSVRLKSGDKIRFDEYGFVFVLPDQAPVGATVLVGGKEGPKQGQTTIRPGKQQAASDQKSDGEVEEKPREEAQEEPSPPKTDPPAAGADEPEEAQEEEPPGTIVKGSGMCHNHPARKAVHVCGDCKRAFCDACVSEKDGRILCAECAGK